MNIYRKLAYSAVLVALGVSLGYALAWIPNVELVSFICVLTGYTLGFSWGIIDGALIFLLFSFLSPFGMAPLPVWIAQGIGGAFLGFCGAFAGNRMTKPFIAAGIAIAGTVIYDLSTNIAGFFTFPTERTFMVYIIGGMSFSIVHIATNGLIFALLFPLIISKVIKNRL